MYVKLNQPYSVARSAAVFQIRGKDSERWNAGTRTVLHCYYYAVLASLIALYMMTGALLLQQQHLIRRRDFEGIHR